MTLGEAAQLLGKEVRVTLSRDTDDPSTICSGTLLHFNDGGEVTIRDEMGFVHYCWPMLTVEEL